MSDAENMPQTPTDDGLSKHESDVPSDVPTSTSDSRDDNASVDTANEVHEDGDETPHAGEEIGTAGDDEVAAPAVPMVDSQEAEPKETAADKEAARSDDKPVKKTALKGPTPKSSPVKSRSSVGTAPLTRKSINVAKPTASVITKAASATTAVPKSTATSTLKKSSSTTATSPSKATAKTAAPRTSIASAKQTMNIRPAPSPIPPTNTRRPSVPPKPVAPSTLTGRRPASPAPDTVKTTTRSITPTRAVTPTGSAKPPVPTKPRAPVSDGMPTHSRRTSLGPKPAPPVMSKPAVGAFRRTPTAGSISSLRDIKEDNAAVGDLQKKLEEAQKAVQSSTGQVEALQNDLRLARDELEAALAEAESKRAALDELTSTKAALEEHASSNNSLVDELRASIETSVKDLDELKAKLADAESEASANAQKMSETEKALTSMSEQHEMLRREYEALQASSSGSANAAAETAAIEHAALLKARDDLEAIRSELSSVTAAHDTAMSEAHARIQELETTAVRTAELEEQLAHLKAEKEETTNRLSEVEVEILELRELMETAEDKERHALEQMKALEEKITKMASDNEQALIESRKRDEAHEYALCEAQKQLSEASAEASAEQEKLAQSLKLVEGDLADAVSRYEQALEMAKTAEASHAARFEEIAKLQAEKEQELASEIQRLSAELAGQEAQYAEKVANVKREHDVLLEEAFEKAKIAAGSAHGQDLHDLRMKSDAMIEQLNVAHKSYVEDLKAEHQAELDARVKALDKTISNLNIELKATQDDLSKAKASLAAAAEESEKLKKQVEAAEKLAASAATSSTGQHASEILRLTRELSSATDESSALKEVLAVQKDSMSEMSDAHSSELEMMAKMKAEELIALKKAHESETMTLVKEKSDLASRVADLEGEVATLHATLAAHSSASVKSNGVASSGTSTNVSKEELQKLHEAHTLKMRDLEAQHETHVKSLRGDLESANGLAHELTDEVNRRSMEVRYLEADMEEKDDTITRLKDELDQLKKHFGLAVAA